jgi:alcohol dehydrogenase
MRALTYVGPEKLEWRERPDPRVGGPGEAVVRPVAATTCDLDKAIVAGRTPLPPPFALGHECVAEVVEVGDAVRAVAPGQLVVVPWSLHCGVCARCRAGLTASCQAVPPRAMYGTPIGGDFGGLFSELVHVPFADAMLVPLPAGAAPVAVASASDNLTDAWIAASRGLERHPGAPVLVVGGVGALALYVVEMARAAGAAAVTFVDRSPERLARAEALGARVLARAAGDLPEHEVVIDASGHPGELLRAARAVAPGGICVSLGVYFLDTALPMLDMYAKDVTFRIGRPSVGPHIRAVLDLVASGRVHPERLATVAPWESAVETLLARPLKPVLVRAPVV